MVRTFLKVYMELGSYFLFLQEQIKDIIIISAEEISALYCQIICVICEGVKKFRRIRQLPDVRA